MKAKHSHVHNFPKYSRRVKNLSFSVLFYSWFSELSAVKMYEFLSSYCCFVSIIQKKEVNPLYIEYSLTGLPAGHLESLQL